MKRLLLVLILVSIAPLLTLAPIRNIAFCNEQLVYVLVDSAIQAEIESRLNRWQSDVAEIGFRTSVIPISCSECTPEDVRAILIDAYSEGLVGCLFVGDIPWPIFEIEDPQCGYEFFPIDLFYMDLDGNWTDTDDNGKYDQHTGHRAPEIWLGRLKASNMSESEISLLQRYFDKNHAYRVDGYSLSDRALIYLDDDWIGASGVIDSDVGLLFDERVLVNDKNTTCAEDYTNRLEDEWTLIHLRVHGGFNYHCFMTNKTWAGSVFSEDIRTAAPKVLFYNVISCKNAKFDEMDYIAGWYLFSGDGLAVISTTETGGMLLCSDFYGNFSENNLGFSFKAWLTQRIIEEDDGHWYSKDWFYGMCVLGDPTLFVPDTDKPVTLIGDLNEDKCVDMLDVTMIAIIFGTTRVDPRFDQRCDLNSDGLIDIVDLVIVAHDFGKSYS